MKILNFGSLNIDIVYGVDHFARAGETVPSSSCERFCGGKGLNQSVALARAGAEAYHAGCVGEDGEMLLQTLRESGADTRFVRRIAGPSGNAVIQVDRKGQNSILLYAGANHRITQAQIDAVFSFFAAGDLLLLQNEVNLLPQLVEAAYQKGMAVALNPSPIGEALDQVDFHKVRYLILNELEGRELTGEEAPDGILAALRGRYPATGVVLTLGGDGAVYAGPDGSCSHGIYQVPVVDTTGAGDTFTGYFLSCLAAGDAPERALHLASVASSIAVSRMGASPSIPTMEEVLAAEGTLKLIG